MGRWFYVVITICYYVVIATGKPPSCTTPNGELASCVSLFSCPILQEAIGSKDASLNVFIEASSCGDGKFMVCCGTARNFTNKPDLGNRNKGNGTSAKEAHRNLVLTKLLPSKEYCGLQHTDDYFYNQTATSIDEFPWMVYIPLRANDRHPTPGTEIKCSGVLLNNRYVLSAAYCAAHVITTVKLGLYHKQQNVSCIPTSYGEDDCTEPAVEIEVGLRLYPPNADHLLIRLKDTVTYTDYIRPICLPFDDSDRPKIGDTVVTSGWGEADSEGKQVKIKKRIKHTLVNIDECPKTEAISVCAVTTSNTTNQVCFGDDGGPLMYKHKNNWFVEGIITTPTCFNNAPFPSQHITPEILEWIIEKMHP